MRYLLINLLISVVIRMRQMGDVCEYNECVNYRDERGRESWREVNDYERVNAVNPGCP